MSDSVCFNSPLSVYVYLCPFLTVCVKVMFVLVNFCPIMFGYVRLCPLVSVSVSLCQMYVPFSQLLSDSVRFCQFLSFPVSLAHVERFSVSHMPEATSLFIMHWLHCMLACWWLTALMTADRHTNRKIDKTTDRQRDIQTDKQTD